MNCRYCGGSMYQEPADDAHVGPAGPQRVQLMCFLCGRSPDALPPSLPLVASNRITPKHRQKLAAWKARP